MKIIAPASAPNMIRSTQSISNGGTYLSYTCPVGKKALVVATGVCASVSTYPDMTLNNSNGNIAGFRLAAYSCALSASTVLNPGQTASISVAGGALIGSNIQMTILEF